MTFRNMRIFLAVADCGSMSEAAKRLSIAQPSVSGTIAEIEEKYGIRLFERLGRKLYITPTGVQLERYARHILSAFDDMERELKNSNQSVFLRIGATLTVGACILADLIEQFQKQCPHVETQVAVYNTQQIEQMLLRSELDAAIVEGKVESRDLCSSVIMNDPMALIVSAQNNPFAGCETVTRDDLVGLPFVMREKGSGTRALFEQAMENRTIREQWVCSSSEAILGAVERGFGCAVLSRRLAQERLQKGSLVEIPIEDASLGRSFCVVWHKNKHQSEAFRTFIHLCESIES